MFNNNPLSSRTEQVTQQVYEPIHVPIIIGNEVYVLAQQDVRNVIDTRYMACTKCPNGLKDLQEFFVMLNNQNTMQQHQIQCGVPQYIPQACFELMNNAAIIIQCHCLQNHPTEIMPASVGPHDNIASVQTQIDWEMKDCQAIKPDQFTYGKRTSTTDLRDLNFRSVCNKSRPYSPRPILRVLISKGTNTSAMEIVDELEKQMDETSDQTPPPSAQEVRKQQKQRKDFVQGIE